MIFALESMSLYNVLPPQLKMCVCRLMAFVKVVKNTSSDLPNEYMYGRAGFLFALLYVNKHVSPRPFSESSIRSVNF